MVYSYRYWVFYEKGILYHILYTKYLILKFCMFLRRRRIAVLLIGDIFLFYLALFFTTEISYSLESSAGAFAEHFIPFSYLIALWVIVFFIAGLYEKETLFFRRKLPSILLGALVSNGIIAIAFFYFVSVFFIAPKTNLFIYLAIAFLLLFTDFADAVYSIFI